MPSLTYGGFVTFATYRDLWLEAGDPHRVAAFWAAVLGMDLEPFGQGGYLLASAQPERSVYVVPSSPGSLTGFRLHVDLAEDDLVQVRQLVDSATDHDDDEPWLELSGPEDSELRCFPTVEPPADRRYEMVLAAERPTRAARWWARVFGAVHESAAGGDYAWVSQIPGAPFETLLFTREMPYNSYQRARMRLTTIDMPGLIRYGAAMVAGEHPVTDRGIDARLPTHVMRCAEGIEFVVVDASGSPEMARSSRPAKPVMGPR